jgi:preprotein translocase SecE subunit
MPDGVAAKAKADKGKAPVASDGLWTRMKRFFRESNTEVFKKAQWPTWPEVQKFTIIVIVAVLAVGIWIAGIDNILGFLTKTLFNR